MLKQKSIFARSPIRPIQRHMKEAHACVECLLPFYEAAQKNEWDACQGIYDQICDLEHKADDMKRDLRLHLPKSLLLPVSRSDLLALLAQQEVLANKAKDIAGIMLGRKMNIPEKLAKSFQVYLCRSIDASKQARDAINELDELLESGFRGKEVAFVETMIDELNVIEHETDKMQIHLRQILFGMEQQFHPIDVMFLYKIIDWVGCLADAAQQAGYQLQLLLAES